MLWLCVTDWIAKQGVGGVRVFASNTADAEAVAAVGSDVHFGSDIGEVQ